MLGKVLLLAFVFSCYLGAYAQVTLSPSPVDCGVTRTFSNAFNSVGVVTVDIKSTVSEFDEIHVVPSASDDFIVVSTTYISDSAEAVNSFQMTNSTSQTTLSLAISSTYVPPTPTPSPTSTSSPSSVSSSSSSSSTTQLPDSAANTLSKSVMVIIAAVFASLVLAKKRPSPWMLAIMVLLCGSAVWAASGCGVRAVIKVYAPPTVHTVCFNGQCFCNCAVKGSGVNIHFVKTANNIVNLLGNTGFGTVRMDFKWQSIESTKGVYDFSRSGEWGYTTANNTVDDRVVTEEQQAQYVIREYLNNLAQEVPVSIWYDFNDDGKNLTESEDNFGLFRNFYWSNRTQAFDFKPAGLAVTNFFSLLRNLKFNKLIPVTSPFTYVALFTDGGNSNKTVIAFWTTSNSTNAVAFQLTTASGTSFTLSNMYGNQTTTLTSTGSLTLTPSQSPQYLVFNQQDDIFDIIAAIPRLPIDVPACASNAKIPVSIPNLSSRTLRVVIGDLAEVSILPGQTAFAYVTAANQNSQASFQTIVPVQIVGLVSFGLITNLVCDSAIYSAITLSGPNVIFTLSNPSGAAFSGNLSFDSSSQPARFVQGETTVNVSFPAPSGSNATGSIVISYTLIDSDGNTWFTKSQALQLATNLLTFSGMALPSPTFVIANGGNNSIAYNASVVIAPIQIAPSVTLYCFSLNYTFTPGWRYFQINPQNKGQINSLQTVNMWVYGDNSRNTLRTLFVDASGQSLQYTFGQISWEGWRMLSLNITTAFPGYWNGDNDGIPKFPLKWSSYFLLDSNKNGSTGSIHISAPTLVL